MVHSRKLITRKEPSMPRKSTAAPVPPPEDALAKLNLTELRKVVAKLGLFDTSIVTWLSERETRDAILNRYPLSCRAYGVERVIDGPEELPQLVLDRKAWWRDREAKKKAAASA
jgi:hypothetical protein